MSTSEIISLQQFTSKLLAHYQQQEHAAPSQSLVLGDALLLYNMIYPQTPSLNTQLVVTGPTQSGKSTVVNLLLGGEFAQPSPLAGFTRHGQGFSDQAVNLETAAIFDSLLPWLKRVERESLNDEELASFSIEATPSDSELDITTWDTPDFDSVSSRGYRATVPQLCAIADAIILVVSREKYADQTVWTLLELLASTGKPITLLLNKVSEANQSTLLEAIQGKLASNKLQSVQVASLPYLDLYESNDLLSHPEALTVRQQLLEWAKSQARGSSKQDLRQFVQNHWTDWTQDIETELNARDAWKLKVETVMAEARQHFEEDYIHKTDHSDALQKAMLRLLELLEIPAVAGTLGRLRQVITWPARQLGGFLKKQPEEGPDSPDYEQQVLEEQLQLAILSLSEFSSSSAEKNHDHAEQWWNTLSIDLEQLSARSTKTIQQSINEHQEAFAPQIEQAAQSLHTHLQSHPATLNGLRAARVSTDAAAVALAIKSGGLGLSDLVFAPAMLAFTSMLTEGALGQYMSKIEQELQESQLASVEALVFKPLEEQLMAVGENLRSSELIGIQKEELEQAAKALEDLA